MDLSLITSLYRSSEHLAGYINRTREIIAQLDLQVEIVIVANDATPGERELLAGFEPHDNLHVTQLDVGRESVYASWNRGIGAASSDILGFWNVDDTRTAIGLQEGYTAIHDDGAELVDFAFESLSGTDHVYTGPHYDPDFLDPKTGLGPFFMFHRDMYQQAGAFNPNFYITGDYEWSKRARVRTSHYHASQTVGGQFVLHGGNLSGGYRPREWVEFNIALIWHGGTDLLRPVDPELMRDLWDAWGCEGGNLPADLREWLWGTGARLRYDTYTRERQQPAWFRRLRLALARRGLVKSVEWDVHH